MVCEFADFCYDLAIIFCYIRFCVELSKLEKGNAGRELNNVLSRNRRVGWLFYHQSADGNMK